MNNARALVEIDRQRLVHIFILFLSTRVVLTNNTESISNFFELRFLLRSSHTSFEFDTTHFAWPILSSFQILRYSVKWRRWRKTCVFLRAVCWVNQNTAYFVRRQYLLRRSCVPPSRSQKSNPLGTKQFSSCIGHITVSTRVFSTAVIIHWW